jgi:S1-C subfamily serine protease
MAAGAQRSIPDNHLAMPVLVELEGFTGGSSGFYLHTASDAYFVTAKHVLLGLEGDPLATKVVLTSYPANPKDRAKNVFELDLARLQQSGELKTRPGRDIAVVRIARLGELVSENRRKSVLLPGVTQRDSAETVWGATVEMLKKYDDVLVANQVFVFGYPTSLGLKQTPQVDSFRPLLRTGIVAGRNPTTETLIIDCPTYPGNSGGPVVEIVRDGFNVKFSVVGVVSQWVPVQETRANRALGYIDALVLNSGYSVVTPMDAVLALIQQSPPK